MKDFFTNVSITREARDPGDEISAPTSSEWTVLLLRLQEENGRVFKESYFSSDVGVGTYLIYK